MIFCTSMIVSITVEKFFQSFSRKLGTFNQSHCVRFLIIYCNFLLTVQDTLSIFSFLCYNKSLYMTMPRLWFRLYFSSRWLSTICKWWWVEGSFSDVGSVLQRILRVEVDSAVPLAHHDPRNLRLICLVKERKIYFRILSDSRVQSWIFWRWTDAPFIPWMIYLLLCYGKSSFNCKMAERNREKNVTWSEESLRKETHLKGQ